MNLEEILIHMFYALETNDLETYVYLRAKALVAIREQNRKIDENTESEFMM